MSKYNASSVAWKHQCAPLRDRCKSLTFAAKELEHGAADLFRRAAYCGRDGGVFWQAAGLVRAGLLDPDAVANAAEECALSGVRNLPAAFFGRLADRCRGQVSDLRHLCDRVRILAATSQSAADHRLPRL